jgi:hypothetical protein
MISSNTKVKLPPSNLPNPPFASTPANPRGLHFGPKGNVNCAGGCYYSPKFPSNGDKKTDKSATADPPTVLSNRDEVWRNNASDYVSMYDAQLAEEEDLINTLKSTASIIKSNRIWNPSDDVKDPLGSYAINYNNHGALTKLFMKPTLPFSINYYGM